MLMMCRSTRLAWGVLLALACPGAHAGMLAPEDAAASSARAEDDILRVSVAPEIVDASLIPGWIDQRNQRLEEQVPRLEGHQQWIAVNVAGGTYDYRVTVTPMRDGVAVGFVPPPATCACTSEKLLALVDEQIARAIEQLQTAPLQEQEQEPTTVPPPVAPPIEAQSTSEPPPSSPAPKRRRISGLGAAGAVATGLGASAVVGGIVMTGLGRANLTDAIDAERNWRFPGVVTLAVGGAVLATGVSMLVADIIQCRKADTPRRCERRGARSRLELGPSFEVNGGSVILKGRF